MPEAEPGEDGRGGRADRKGRHEAPAGAVSNQRVRPGSDRKREVQQRRERELRQSPEAVKARRVVK